MAKDVADLVRKFEASANAVPPTLDKTISTASLRTKQLYIAAAVRAGLTPGKRLNVGRKGTRWGVGYEKHTADSGSVASIVRYKGPVHLINNDTKPHLIESKAARARRRQEGKALIQLLTGKKVNKSKSKFADGDMALNLPSGPVASIQHPGTTGKDFFKPADEFARNEVARIVGDSRREILVRGGFGGI